MALSSNELQQRLEWLANVVRKAGDVVLKYYDGNARVEYKAPADPVTIADRAANEFLVNEIQKAFPDDAVLAEESKDDPRRFERSLIWMVDPLDGTKEFIARNGEFSVMVGLVEDGHPVLGAVYQPTEDRLYLGARGVMARLEENGLQSELRVSIADDVRQLGTVAQRVPQSGAGGRRHPAPARHHRFASER
ncbi:MAG: inositol monophosphatase family protein [candidate division KSB1 bacterium]|nr:inositol monophosphatase family protein [candidate division KSB1 bacterium]